MLQKNLIPQKRCKTNFVKTAGLLFISVLSNPTGMFAQGDPSLDNIQKATEAAREQIRHDEIMSYIYMGIGFIIVLAIAWFTNVRVQKRRDLEAFHRKSAVHHRHHPHDPHRPHDFKKKLHKQVS